MSKKMDRKFFIIVLVAAVILVGFIGMNSMKPGEEPAPSPPQKTTPSTGVLKEEQIVACNAADRAGTCNTKLPKLVGLVTMEDCCRKLGKCCQP